jgi:hypothetical protein
MPPRYAIIADIAAAFIAAMLISAAFAATPLISAVAALLRCFSLILFFFYLIFC